MDKYRINYIYNESIDINDIFIKVLNKELRKYIQMICRNKKCEISLPGIYLSCGGDKNC